MKNQIAKIVRLFEIGVGSSYQFVMGLTLAIALNLLGLLPVFDSLSSMLSEVEYSDRFDELKTQSAPQTTVFLIDQDDFRSVFDERSPLNRCALAKQFSHILERSHGKLIVDLDLAPLINANSAEATCQTELESTLIKHKSKVWLMHPISNANVAWKNSLTDKFKINFFDPYFTVRFGLLGLQPLRDLGVLQTLSDQERALSSYSQNSVQNSDQNPLFKISYEGLKTGRIGVFHASDIQGLNLIPGKYIIYGGDWDSQDRYLTPIGTDTPGALIHAAIVDTYLNTKPDWFGRFFVLNVGGFLMSLALFSIHQRIHRVDDLDEKGWINDRLLHSRGFYSVLVAFLLVCVCIAVLGTYLVVFNPTQSFLPELFGIGLSHLFVGAIMSGNNYKGGRTLPANLPLFILEVVYTNLSRLTDGNAFERILFLGWLLKWVLPISFILIFWELL